MRERGGVVCVSLCLIDWRTLTTMKDGTSFWAHTLALPRHFGRVVKASGLLSGWALPAWVRVPSVPLLHCTGATVFAPKHVHRSTNLLSKEYFDTSFVHAPTVTVAILAQGTRWTDVATQAYFAFFHSHTCHSTCGTIKLTHESEESICC